MILGLGLGFVFASIAKSNTPESAQTATSTLKLRPIAEVRERLERREGNSTSAGEAHRSDLVGRYRAGVGFDYDKLSGEFVFQYGHDLEWALPENESHQASNLLLGFVKTQSGDDWDTVGRQRIVKGSERILGENDWNNTTNTWDALRVTGKSYDLFAGKLATAARESADSRMAGFSIESKLGLSLVLVQHDVDPQGQRLDLYTFDQSYSHTVMGLDLTLEAIGEEGAHGPSDVQAFATTVSVAKPYGNKFGVTLAGALASGGQNNLFTNYYGTKQPFDGISGNQGFANLKELSAAMSYAWSPKIKSTVTYYHFGLYDATDGWYGKYDTVNSFDSTQMIDPSGANGTDVGQEVDFETKWKFRKDTEISGGFASFIPGAFIKAFNLPNGAQSQYWFYGQVNCKFKG